MIVIDIGCARYGGDYSIEHLIEEFHPDVLYGFDPNQGPDEYPWSPNPPNGPTGPTKAGRILIEKKAAWVYDGEVRFHEAGLGSTVGKGKEMVPCFDLARFIKELPGDGHVLKMDCEMAEYTILPHLIEQDADLLLSLAWIEWHPYWEGIPEKRQPIEAALRCEVREWRY